MAKHAHIKNSVWNCEKFMSHFVQPAARAPLPKRKGIITLRAHIVPTYWYVCTNALAIETFCGRDNARISCER